MEWEQQLPRLRGPWDLRAGAGGCCPFLSVPHRGSEEALEAAAVRMDGDVPQVGGVKTVRERRLPSRGTQREGVEGPKTGLHVCSAGVLRARAQVTCVPRAF